MRERLLENARFRPLAEGLSARVAVNNKWVNLADAHRPHPRWKPSRTIPALVLAFLAAGCATHNNADQSASQQAAAPPQAATSAPLPGPEAKIHISYARPSDFLSSLAVTKYSTAQNVLTLNAEDGRTSSIIRFGGGVGVWQINVDRSLLSDVPVLGKDKAYALTEVRYGSVPRRFGQSVPDGEPPEPLEPDHFYIFTVTRASGSTSYEAVKVDGDGSLEAYDAEPRAGTSFRLCCNVGADFTITVAPPANANPSAP